jgi:CRP-like cAMP-binding protein
MLSSRNSSDAVIKVVDFGCAEIINKNSPFYDAKGNQSFANTPGYSPPEMIDRARRPSHLEPSADMFSMGVIIYIMLTGVHPFDIDGQSTDQEMNQRVLSGKMPPLRNSQITAHLSPSAIDLIERLMANDPKKRMSALRMLSHPWIRGETAKTGKIADSDKKLKSFRKYKSGLEARVFASMVQASDDSDDDDLTKKTSLIQRSFQMIDSEHRGYITTGDLKKLDQKYTEDGEDDSHLSLSGFSELVSENMKSIFLPAGHVIFREGEEGDKIYFINSGRVEVSTKDGFKATTEQGDFFGEGALLSTTGKRNATIKCITPLDAIEISKEYFEKYLAGGSSTEISVREKDRLRRQNRAKAILGLQHRLDAVTIENGGCIYEKGEEGNDIFLVENGVVDMCVDGHPVYSVQPGELFGAYAYVKFNFCALCLRIWSCSIASFATNILIRKKRENATSALTYFFLYNNKFSTIFGRPRNTTALCASKQCKIQIMEPKDFDSIMKSNPSVREGLREVVLRREFKKALVFATKKPFPQKVEELKEAFIVIDDDKSGEIDLSEIGVLLRKMDSTFTDDDIEQILNSLDIDGGGDIGWEEFKRIFGMTGTKFVKCDMSQRT